MIACVDVHYLAAGGARAALVVFPTWEAARPSEERIAELPHVAPYEPGSFYKRELPGIRAVLATLLEVPEVVIVDGHAWLGPGRPGLGARLLEAEPRVRTVVGVAKTRFAGAPAEPVRRGSSVTPLWVDEVGVHVDAPARVARMHGLHRVPTMLRLADQLCRGLVSSDMHPPVDVPLRGP